MGKLYLGSQDSYKDIGGEAFIYFRRNSFGRMLAVKVYKDPDHPGMQDAPDFQDPAQQRAARERLRVMQSKLRDFPEDLPERVITPQKLKSLYGNNKISGYTMRYIGGAEKLQLYHRKDFRKKSGISNNTIMEIFRDLHQTVSALHRRGIVIGDFNDENILIKGNAAYIVDTDSFQFGSYPCQMFKPEFVDPQLCKSQAEEMMLVRSHNTDSDWYAFTVMLLWCLLHVHPYGGIYFSQTVPRTMLPLHRLSVFHKDVRYPGGAVPLDVLPDALREHLRAVFRQDRRGVFPIHLLDIRWKRCFRCGIEHARQQCPVCA